MKEVVFDNVKYDLKSDWNEIDKNEFLMIAYIRQRSLFTNDQEMLNAQRIALFHSLSKVPIRKLEKVSAEQWVDILPHMNWVFESPTFKQNPIYRIKIAGKEYVGPSGLLDSSTIREMADADTFFIRACNNADESMLYRVLSVLYRPVRSDLKSFMASPEWNGDIREPYNSTRAKENAEKFSKLNIQHFAVAAFLYYQAFRTQRLMSFKNVFSIPDVDPKQRSGNDYGWAGTLLEIAKNGEFGPLDQTEKQPWSTILVSMSKNADMRKQLESKINQNK